MTRYPKHLKSLSIRLYWTIVVHGCCMTLPALSQQPDRFLTLRNQDSVWMVERFLLPTRFYIGNEQISRRTWENHLIQGDQEVNAVLNRARKQRRTGNWLLAGALATTTAGFLIVGSSNPSADELFYACMLGGIAELVVSGLHRQEGGRLLRYGMRTYNGKANAGKLQPLTLRLYLGPSGAGLAFRW